MSNISETNQLDVGGWAPDTLHAWVRSMLDQIDRRNEQRFVEQEKALDKAFNASREVVLVNFSERDKAVQILAEALRDRIKAGEVNLTDHITQQIDQIRLLLDAAKELTQVNYKSADEKILLIKEHSNKAIEERIVGVELQIKGVHREIDIEADATKTAIGKADAANEKRFESVNEFRAQMADQSALFISRREVEAMVGANAEKVAALTDRINRSEGRGTGKEQLWGYLIGGIAVFFSIMMYFSTHNAEMPALNSGKINANETKIEVLQDDIKQLRQSMEKKP